MLVAEDFAAPPAVVPSRVEGKACDALRGITDLRFVIGLSA